MPRTARSQDTIERWRSYWSANPTRDHQYASSEFFRRQADELQVLFGAKRPTRVLEMGCGSGLLFPFLGLDPTGYRGIDFSPAAIAEFRAAYPDLDLVCCEGSSYYDPGGGYDLIFSNELVQYFDAHMLDTHVRNARGMLADDGLLVCANVLWKAHLASLILAALKAGRLGLALNRMRFALLGDTSLGRWQSSGEFVALARRHDFAIEFFGAMAYPGRLHAVMRPQ